MLKGIHWLIKGGIGSYASCDVHLSVEKANYTFEGNYRGLDLGFERGRISLLIQTQPC